MAISIGTNFKVNSRKPLDEKQVVDTNAELANIEAAFKGLVVHVADNDAKTYVCVDDDVANSLDGSGDPLPAFWKELADTASIDAAIAALIGGAPGTLDTLNEIAFSIDDNPDFIGAMNTLVGTKANTVHAHNPDAIAGPSASPGQVLTYNGTVSGWANAAGGGNTSVLADDAQPAGILNKVTLWSADEESAESQPDHLYLFDEGASVATATDSGRALSAVDGTKSRASGSTAYTEDITGTLANFDRSGLFTNGEGTTVSVGSTSGAPYVFTGDVTGKRADFEIEFQLGSISPAGKIHTLISTDPSTHNYDAKGFYSVLLNHSASSGASSIIFEYYNSPNGAKLQTIEWTIPVTVAINTTQTHIALSFMEDDRTYAGLSTGAAPGKFRCYFDGVVLEDKNNPGTNHIAGEVQGLGRIHPVPASATSYGFNDNLNEAGGGTAGTEHGTVTYEDNTDNGGAGVWGKRVSFTNVQNYGGTNFVSVPNPNVGSGDFTIEFFLKSSITGGNQGILSNAATPATALTARFSFISTGSNALRLYHYDDNGAYTTSDFNWSPAFKWDAGGSPHRMSHVAIVRSVSGATATWSMWEDGGFVDSKTTNVANFDASGPGAGDDWFLRGCAGNAYTRGIAGEANFDDLRITKSAVYSGTGGITVPVAPYISPPTNHPVSIGRYLDGAAASGGPAALFHFASNYTNDVSGGPTMSVTTDAGGSVTNNTSHPTFDAAFGTQLRIMSTNYWDNNYATLNFGSSSPLTGTGAFTIEFFVDFSSTATWAQTILCTPSTGSGFDGIFRINISQFVVVLDHWKGGSSEQIQWSTDGGNPAPKLPYPSSNGTMKHFVLQRSAESGGNVTWKLGFDGVWIANNAGGSQNPTIGYADIDATSLHVGFNTQNVNQERGLKAAWIDDLRISAVETYSGSSTVAPLTYTAPIAPFAPPLDPSTRFFTGKMHEFALYNNRCLHNTSDPFQISDTPTRSVPLSVASVVDSESTAAHLLTTRNFGDLLPKHIEGLEDGSPWNDKGVVRIAPMTGDKDGPPIQTQLTIPRQAEAPTPYTDAARIYARNPLANAVALFDFDGDVENGVLNSSDVANHGQITGSTVYTGQSFGSGGGDFGRRLTMLNNSVGNVYFNDLTHIAVGAADFTVEMFLTFADVTETNNVLSCAQSTGTPAVGYFALTYNSNGTLFVTMYDGLVWNITHNPASLVNDERFHIAFVQKGLTQSLYYNGVRVNYNVSSAAFQLGQTAGSGWYIGRLGDVSDGVDDFEGTIDQLLITADAKYTSASFIVPTVPYSLTATKFFAIDSEGNETQLTP